MSKKVRTIIIGGVVVILLAGLLVFLLLNPPKPKEEEETTPSIESTSVTLIDEEMENFVSVKIKNEKDEYTISSQGENVWGITEIMDFSQDTAMYTTAISSLFNVTAMDTVEENSTDLDKFGLKNPKAVAAPTFKGDKTYSISIGNLSSDGSTRYVCMTGENTVYSFSATAFNSMFNSRYDYLTKDVIPGYDPEDLENMPKMDYFSVSRPDLDKPIILEKGSPPHSGPNAASTYVMTMTSPVNALVNETPAKNFVMGNFGIVAQDIVKANPTAAVLTEYGFDVPTSVLTMKYNSTSSVKLTTGKGIKCTHEKDEDLKDHTHKIVSYYAMREGTDLVYVLDAAKMPWFTMEYSSVLSNIAVLPNILDIDTVDITVDNKTHSLDFIDGADAADYSMITATFDSKDVSIEYAKKYLQLLYLSVIQDVNTDKTTTKKPDASIKYNYKNGNNDVVDFYVLDDLSCILSVNGNMAFTSRSAMVEKLRVETENLLQNKAVDTDW